MGAERRVHRVINAPMRAAALTLGAALVVVACGGGSSPGPSGGSGDGPTPPDCLSFADIYAIVGPESEGFSNWSESATIASELGSTTEFPDLGMSITAPGEESGTFDSFVEIIDIPGVAEERAAEPNVDTDNDGTLDGWSTRADYVGQPNDNAIIDGIANSTGSFGWVGFAFYEENLDSVRAFTIAEEPGGPCIEPTPATIASNEYPISRDLFIYVSKSKAEANPALVAYVDYYLADGTIDMVLETVPYVPLEAATLAETRSAWESFKGSMAADPNGSIFVSGSSTVEPISNGVAESFQAASSGFDYVVEGPGTGDGFAQFCAGQTDISDASRPIRDAEVADCQAAGIEYVELKIAIDGIAVMTQK
jgi:ABC-type phosphate transport system substrate-binding protein